MDVTVILQALSYYFKNFSYRLQDILPVMPDIVTDFPTLAAPYLGYLNWFFPVGDCLEFMGATLSLLGVWYGSKYILKRMGVI